jgi:flagellar protein FliS
MALGRIKDYQENAISQADGVRLVQMMYDGTLKFLRLARDAVGRQDFEETHHNVLRAYAIISELMATLNFEDGGEIARNLEVGYDYLLHLLREAEIHKRSDELDEAISIVELLAESWREAFALKIKPPPDNGQSGEEGAEPSGNGGRLDLIT